MIKEQKHGTGYDMSEVRILKGPTIAKFKCSNCGTEFEVPKYKCKTKMTGMNEYHTVFRCPTCRDECWSNMTEKLTEEEIIEQFAEYVKEQKITVYTDAETKTLHIFKTPKNAPWLKDDN